MGTSGSTIANAISTLVLAITGASGEGWWECHPGVERSATELIDILASTKTSSRIQWGTFRLVREL